MRVRAIGLGNFFDMPFGVVIVDTGRSEVAQIETPLPYSALSGCQQLVGRRRYFTRAASGHAACSFAPSACAFAICSILPTSSAVMALRFLASVPLGLNCRGTC